MESVARFLPFVLKGLVVTVELSTLSVMLSVVLGLAGAWAKLSGSRMAKRVAELYTLLVRGVPDLVLMLMLYYGGQRLLNFIGTETQLWKYVELNAFTSGIVAIGFIFGAYMTETFRGAYLALPRGQVEAGISLGFKRPLLFWLIVWPQLLRHALPSFTNNWLTLMKSTALVSVIGLEDVVYNGYSAGKSTHLPFTFMLIVLLIYLMMTIVSDIGLTWLERRYGTEPMR